jgi:hypothetical protein
MPSITRTAIAGVNPEEAKQLKEPCKDDHGRWLSRYTTGGNSHELGEEEGRMKRTGRMTVAATSCSAIKASCASPPAVELSARTLLRALRARRH